jgi:hypothetical protein
MRLVDESEILGSVAIHESNMELNEVPSPDNFQENQSDEISLGVQQTQNTSKSRYPNMSLMHYQILQINGFQPPKRNSYQWQSIDLEIIIRKHSIEITDKLSYKGTV